MILYKSQCILKFKAIFEVIIGTTASFGENAFRPNKQTKVSIMCRWLEAWKTWDPSLPLQFSRSVMLCIYLICFLHLYVAILDQ